MVEARPVKIAAHRRAGLDRAEHGAYVSQNILGPQGVLAIRDAIFGDVDWQTLTFERSQRAVQAFGIELPVHVRPKRVGREHPLAEQFGAIAMIEFHELAGVVIQADRKSTRLNSS